MEWLQVLQVLWPIAVCLIPLVLGAGFLWLRTKFPSKADLDGTETRLAGRIDAHDGQLKDGSRRMAELDKRVAIVEEECKAIPTKSDLAQSMSVHAGRLSGVESALRGVEKQVGTIHDYLHTVIEHGLKGGGK